jgi:hypothetical protein
MARKTSRRAADSKRKKSPAVKGRKSSATKQARGAVARSSYDSPPKTVSVDKFVRSIRTLHDLGLVGPFVRSAKKAKLTLTMSTAAFERVKESVDKLRKPAPVSRGKSSSTASITVVERGAQPPDHDPWDFGSNSSNGLRHGVKPLPGHDPWDF